MEVSRRRNGHGGLLRNDGGTALVEFAIAVPFLVLLALGIIEIGRYTAYSVVVGNAVRAGAQVGVMGETPAEAPADPNQPNSSSMHSLVTQAACNDAYGDLIVGNPSFSCTDIGAALPADGLLITKTITCLYSDGSTDCSVQPSGSLTRTMYITVSAKGAFTSLLKYPLLPNNVPISAQTTQTVTQ